MRRVIWLKKLETFLQGKLRVSPWETYCIYKGALWTCKDKNKTPHWLAIPIINMVTKSAEYFRVQFLNKHFHLHHIGA